MVTSIAALVSELESRGVMIREDGGRVLVQGKDVPDSAIALLRSAAKEDVLAVLRGRAFGVDWSRVNLYQFDKVLEVAVPWSDVNLIIAPGCRIARELRAQDPRPGRVWCCCELINLLLSGIAPGDARKVAEAKLMFDGTVEGVRQQKTAAKTEAA